MARNEDGEFELIVGNRQLLTIVFIIFVLCGIVFTMGYWVGRNSGPPLPVSPSGKTGTDTSTERPQAAPVSDAAANAQLEPGEARVATPQSAAPPVETVAANPTETVAVTPPPAVEKPQPKPAPQSAVLGSVREPVPGQTYVQVAAVERLQAEAVVDVLQKRSFPAFVGPGPNQNLFRVLIGPVKDAPGIARLKSDLEGLGFKGALVKKY